MLLILDSILCGFPYWKYFITNLSFIINHFVCAIKGDTRTIHLIAEITIQRLSEKKEKTPSVSLHEDESVSNY